MAGGGYSGEYGGEYVGGYVGWYGGGAPHCQAQVHDENVTWLDLGLFRR
jgi:hypothetical protein